MINFVKGPLRPILIKKFSKNFQPDDFFTYVGNKVSLEGCIAVAGILTPDFIIKDDHVFWIDDADNYNEEKFRLTSPFGNSRKTVERYINNFTVSQFFLIWEGREQGVAIEISECEYELCIQFAEILKNNWLLQLNKRLPDRSFEFEIGDDLLDEYGVCMTFSQV